MNNERVIYKIYEEDIQSAAEANLGRELTEVELKRLPCVFLDDARFYDAIYCALINSAEMAMEEDGWEKWDEMYKDTLLTDI